VSAADTTLIVSDVWSLDIFTVKKCLRRVGGRFSWKEGFGAFSYSHSQLSTVV
jgi:hypothetical protein